MVSRLDNWESILSRYLTEKRKESFVWGVNDCVLFAAKGFEQLTGYNFYNEYLPYDDEKTAHDIIRNNGSLEDLVSKHIGHSHREIMKARRGDVILAKLPRPTLGLVDDSGQFIACVSPKGLTRVPLGRAWRVWSY